MTKNVLAPRKYRSIESVGGAIAIDAADNAATDDASISNRRRQLFIEYCAAMASDYDALPINNALSIGDDRRYC